jgi:hypothetical protein
MFLFGRLLGSPPAVPAGFVQWTSHFVAFFGPFPANELARHMNALPSTKPMTSGTNICTTTIKGASDFKPSPHMRFYLTQGAAPLTSQD